jgi:enoyl-CoA hydratase
MFFALDDAIDRASKDDDVRVIIIAANGDDFCCGFDVGDPESSLNANEEGEVTWDYRRANTQEEIDLFMKIFNLKKPVIGAVQGTSLGGGWLIAMCCDCLIASEDAVFSNAELALGLSYTIYLPFDAWKLPMNIAMEKALTGYPITAEEGLRYGLFNRVVPRAELEDAAFKFASRMV